MRLGEFIRIEDNTNQNMKEERQGYVNLFL